MARVKKTSTRSKRSEAEIMAALRARYSKAARKAAPSIAFVMRPARRHGVEINRAICRLRQSKKLLISSKSLLRLVLGISQNEPWTRRTVSRFDSEDISLHEAVEGILEKFLKIVAKTEERAGRKTVKPEDIQLVAGWRETRE